MGAGRAGRPVLLALAALAWTASLAAGDPPPPAPAPAATSLRGTLYGADGRPLAGAAVTAFSTKDLRRAQSEQGPPSVHAFPDVPPAGRAVTDATGRFDVPGLPEGVYALRFEAGGAVHVVPGAVSAPGGGPDGWYVTGRTRDLDGRVVDASGRGVGETPVRVGWEPDPRGMEDVAEWACGWLSARTDPEGRFRVSGIPAFTERGTEPALRVSVRADPSRVYTARVSPEGGPGPVEVVLGGPCALEGTVRRAPGRETVPGALVFGEVQSLPGTSLAFAAPTDAEGRWRVDGCPRGRLVHPWALEPGVGFGAAEGGGSALEPGPPRVVEASVRRGPPVDLLVRGEDGAPRAGARLLALLPAAALSLQSDDRGRIRLDPLPGPVLLRSLEPGTPFDTGVLLDPRASGPLRAEFVLRPSAAVEGTVTDSAGRPAVGAYVEWQDGEEPLAAVRTGIGGTFRMPGLPAGPGRLWVRRGNDPGVSGEVQVTLAPGATTSGVCIPPPR